jgi:hypothetical protein
MLAVAERLPVPTAGVSVKSNSLSVRRQLNISKVLAGLVGLSLSATQPTIFRRFRSFAPYNQLSPSPLVIANTSSFG